jgi:hypothetical protein
VPKVTHLIEWLSVFSRNLRVQVLESRFSSICEGVLPLSKVFDEVQQLELRFNYYVVSSISQVMTIIWRNNDLIILYSVFVLFIIFSILDYLIYSDHHGENSLKGCQLYLDVFLEPFIKLNLNPVLVLKMFTYVAV